VCGVQTWTDHDPLLTHASQFNVHISSVQLEITHNQSVSFTIFLTAEFSLPCCWDITSTSRDDSDSYHFYQS